MQFIRRLFPVSFFAGLLCAALAPMPLTCQTSSVKSDAAPAGLSTDQPADSQPSTRQPSPPQPPGQSYHLPPDKLAKAIAASRIRNILDIVGSFWALAVLWILLDSRAADALESWARGMSGRRWLQGVLFFAVFIVITALAGLPLDIIGEHYDHIYGISVQSWASWTGDQAKSLGLDLVLGTAVLLLFNWIVRRWPRRYWFGLWLATLPLLVLTIFAAPLVDPLFNKFEPLSQNHPALVQQLEKVVARTGTQIPPSRMFLMKASAKTNGLNAYVTGVGATKRIVVWDTTAGRVPDDEVLFIFGHESGHYVLHHIPKMIAGLSVGLFFVYWACAGLANWLAAKFGPRWKIRDLSSRSGFVVLLFVVSVAGFVLQPVSNAISRHYEHQADVYGQEAIHGIVPDPQATTVSAFNHLGEAWLEDPDPSPFIEFWLYNHPSVSSRANFAAHYNPWANNGRGEFFAK